MPALLCKNRANNLSRCARFSQSTKTIETEQGNAGVRTTHRPAKIVGMVDENVASLEELKTAVLKCVSAASAIDFVRNLYRDPEDVYAPCIDNALSDLLHLMSDLLQRCSLAQK